MMNKPSHVPSLRASRFKLVVSTHLLCWSLPGSPSVPWRVIGAAAAAAAAAAVLGGSASDQEPGRLLQEDCSQSKRDWP